jgi:hypothetical protein
MPSRSITGVDMVNGGGMRPKTEHAPSVHGYMNSGGKPHPPARQTPREQGVWSGTTA